MLDINFSFKKMTKIYNLTEIHKSQENIDLLHSFSL